jgi:hypothetical protein
LRHRHMPYQSPGVRAAAPMAATALAAACVSVAACFSVHVARADPTVAAAEAPAAVSGRPEPSQSASIAELRRRYAGSYRYAGSASEQKARTDAIDRSVGTLLFIVRGAARAKVAERTRIVATCEFEFRGGNIRSTVPGQAIAISPETGAPAPYRVNDDAIVLSQRFEGPRLVQVFRADEGGIRKNEFTLTENGALLTMKATLNSPKLSLPVVYTLTYRRVE